MNGAPQITVEVLAAFPWQGRQARPGDRLRVRPVEAAALTYQAKARLLTADEAATPPPAQPTPAPAPVHAATPQRRRGRPRKATSDAVATSALRATPDTPIAPLGG